jgi:hypothetical protein
MQIIELILENSLMKVISKTQKDYECVMCLKISQIDSIRESSLKARSMKN